ncbi:D-Ala-D-Ala carboxypeptidase family metallohydrolase, partial [uncultured Paraglaciecola sp.]|uniref:D-Ala-D-Ala carboxypeptidase family metallohydrolase n=1 Tax=uncultured Paraglaciecola sp. TaxID=1765024 RepID=UPI00263074DF
MKLSKNFALSEIFGSSPANVQQSQTASRLCITILQPLRDWLGHPMVISSGYRSPEHNKKIGSPTSEHTWQGSAGAVDVSIFDHTE